MEERASERGDSERASEGGRGRGMGGGRARETEKGRDGDGDWGLSRSGQPGPAGQPAGGHLPPRRWPPWSRLAPAARHSGRMKTAKTVMFISRLTRDGDYRHRSSACYQPRPSLVSSAYMRFRLKDTNQPRRQPVPAATVHNVLSIAGRKLLKQARP